MPTHNFALPQGRIDHLHVDSRALEGNLLGDPASRTVAVYLPPGYDESSADYPLFVDLVGFTGSGPRDVGWKAFGESLPQRLDRLVAEGRMGPVVAALPDCFTSLGGNQYIDSPAMGQWGTYLTEAMLPTLETAYRVRRGRAHRAVFGKSSGGYGAMVHGMLHAEHWGAIACHSGDMGFDTCYLNEFPAVLRHLARHDGDVSRFVAKLREERKLGGGDMHVLMMLAMCATYDPDPSEPYGIRLPVTADTCEVIPERWRNWRAWDPVELVERADVQRNLASLQGVAIDCGNRDQFNLLFGARRLAKRLEALGIAHRFDEFDDNHSSVDYRMDVSLPYLYAAVTA